MNGKDINQNVIIKDSEVRNVVQTVNLPPDSPVQDLLRDLHEKSHERTNGWGGIYYAIGGTFLVVVSFLCVLFAPQFTWIGFVGIVIILLRSIFNRG